MPRQKSPSSNPSYTPQMFNFCRAQKCRFRLMLDGQAELPYGRSKADIADACINNCQMTAKQYAVWLQNRHAK